MDLIDKVKEIALRIPAQIDHIETEEATKNAFIMPMISALGYDVFNPMEVIPEFTADIGIKKGEKVDYAIKKDNQMNFYSWSRNDPLKINKFGIPEPVSSKIFYPDILFVPLVAYDSSLNRLGYGGGYYDRYIEKIEKIKKVTKIGLAFSFQKISSIPINQYDKKLDFIVTEKGILR